MSRSTKSVVTETERLSALAKLATANATRADTAKKPEDRIPFGSPVSTNQIRLVEEYLGRRDILKFMRCTEKQLRAYSRNEISYSALPAETQQRLRQINVTYNKPWSRKSATIVYTILKAKRKAAPKAPKAAKTATPVEPSSNES